MNVDLCRSLPGDRLGFVQLHSGVDGFRAFSKPTFRGTGSERFQPWWELASHDLCQLAWILYRHSRHVQGDLEVWSHDRGCIGGVQASYLHLHPQARWVARCLGGHWSGQPWEDGDWAAPITPMVHMDIIPSTQEIPNPSHGTGLVPEKMFKIAQTQPMFPLKR